MHQEPPKNGNLARRHNQMFHKKAFSKWQTNNGKMPSNILEQGIPLCKGQSKPIGSTYQSSAKVFMQLFPSSKPSATTTSSS
jgi:hypothetical protein